MLEFNIDIQKQLISAALDDFTPNSAFPNLHGGQFGDTPDAWREAVVTFIQDMVAAGLIAPLAGREGYQAKSAQQIAELLRNGDPETGLDSDLLWDVMHFAGTAKLADLLHALSLDDWQARSAGPCVDLARRLGEIGAIRL
ncbi:MAG TPA: hypothetical protein VF453_05295 [Burkholderiaceae bacterium]